MRADRLLATLLLLQARGRVTAREVAEELEVSVKTSRRDLEALAMSGVPVFSQPGRNGGWQLVGGARTDLTGLRAEEARALFLAAGSAAPSAPGLKDALRKLAQAVPEPFRAEAAAAAEAVLVDSTRWSEVRDHDDPEFLEVLQKAVIDREQVNLGYLSPSSGPSMRTVHPLGLVAKASIWYLVAQTDNGQRTFRVDRVTKAQPTGAEAVRPSGFDLHQAWQQIRVAYDENAHSITAQAIAAPWTLQILRSMFGAGLTVGATRSDGQIDVTITDYSALSLASRTAGLAEGIEITAPPEAVARLAVIGEILVKRYQN